MGACTVVVGLVCSALTVLPSVAAVPPEAQLIAPADGSTAASVEIPLSVRASHPDGGSLQVRFEGRRLGATVPGGGGAGDPFSIVALPDLQNYTYANRQGTIRQQTEWVVSTRSQLNTAMVVQLGDLVSEEENHTQWGRTSTGLKVLDDAGVPNVVVPGNHDFNTKTGAFAEYDQYFPPARYANSSWTPSTASYGGYMGQNLFGPDPVDRKNMNNFALFSAAGRDFLMLNLEWEAPQYAVDWATKVLAAYPERIAVVSTHSFLGLNGLRSTPERTGGTSADKMWTNFISQECSIKLVLSGHQHNGDEGEASRSDLNRCGQPVQQILTDYQDRPNGGDGWLRYYTFDPAASSMTARTYSPKLGTFENDADSSFTVPFDLAGTQPAPFVTIKETTVSSGAVADAIWSALDPNTSYEWRVVTSDGQSSTVSPTWTVKTPAAAEIVDDTFSRNVSNGWGVTAAGQVWQSTSTSTAYAVDGEVGRIVAPVGATRGVRLPTVSTADATIELDVALSSAATGSGAYVSVLGRVNGSSSYRAKIRYLAGGAVTLALIRYTGSEVALASANLPGLTVTPGQFLRLKLELDGSGPTTVRAKLWPREQSEPSAWTVSAVDSTAVLQTSGSLGVDVYTSSAASAPAIAVFDRYTVKRTGTPPPPTNQAPTAVITSPVVDERTISISGTGSSDPDGTIAAYLWDFGDGKTATGSTTTHTYDDDGTYTVRLTVTDDDGSTGTTTRPVSVAATPQTAELASDSFARTVTNGWGVAQKGGSWSSLGAANRYSVTNGTGNHVLTNPGTTAESLLPPLSPSDVDVRANLSWSRTASTGTLYGTVIARRQASGSDYRLKVITASSGTMELVLARKVGTTETTVRRATVPGVKQEANTQYRIAFRATTAGGTTTLAAKLWRGGSAEPTSWLVTAADATAQLQGDGAIGFNSYLSGSAGTGVTMRVSEMLVVNPD